MALEYTWESIGLPEWRDVVDSHALNEPSRPVTQRNKTPLQRRGEVESALGLGGKPFRFFYDYAGRRLFAPAGLLVKKISRYANHAAYAAWIEHTLRNPLEAWIHADQGRFSSDPNELRLHYFAAYVGVDGSTTHLVLAAAFEPRGPKLLNAFGVTALSTADQKRFGVMDYIGYDPNVTARKAKGATPTYQVAPLP